MTTRKGANPLSHYQMGISTPKELQSVLELIINICWENHQLVGGFTFTFGWVHNITKEFSCQLTIASSEYETPEKMWEAFRTKAGEMITEFLPNHRLYISAKEIFPDTNSNKIN